MMLAYHFGMWPSFGHILEKAKQHDVGIVAMKTLKGAKHTNLAELPRRGERLLAGGVPLGAVEPERLLPGDLVLQAPARRRVPLRLRHRADAPRTSRCSSATTSSSPATTASRTAASASSSCPEQLAINDILRYRMYFKDYGWEKEGMRLYAKLERNASRCADLPRAVRRHLPDRRADPREDARRARLLTFRGLSAG